MLVEVLIKIDELWLEEFPLKEEKLLVGTFFDELELWEIEIVPEIGILVLAKRG